MRFQSSTRRTLRPLAPPRRALRRCLAAAVMWPMLLVTAKSPISFVAARAPHPWQLPKPRKSTVYGSLNFPEAVSTNTSCPRSAQRRHRLGHIGNVGGPPFGAEPGGQDDKKRDSHIRRQAVYICRMIIALHLVAITQGFHGFAFGCGPGKSLRLLADSLTCRPTA